MKKNLDIAILNTMPFPSGAASVNRILSYSKGLVELGNNVNVFSSAYGNDRLLHEINGIHYQALRVFSNSRFINIFSLFYALLRFIRILTKSKNRFDVIILVSNSLFLIYPLYLLSKLLGIKLIQEKSEFPFVLNNKTFFGKIFAYYYIHTTYRLFDGLIIMTHNLEKYFKDKVKSGCRTIIVPMTVEPERFTNIPANNLGDYIAYCGDIGGNKDGVKNLITSFSYISNEFPEVKLLLIGGSKDKNERVKLEEYVKKIDCRNVVFFGVVTRDEIPPLLSNAKILALARPSSLQSTGGFPTKLGEYLSTGKPVVVTKVGDISLYLIDNINAYLVEPNDNQAFANKLYHVLRNYDEALSVASRGKELVFDTFNYLVQAKRLQMFLHKVIEK